MFQENEEARQYTYSEIADHFSYDATNKVFKQHSKKRNRYTDKYLTLLYNVSPAFPERFALRLLAKKCKDIRCWKDLRTHNGITYDTYTLAAEVWIRFHKESKRLAGSRFSCH